MTPDRDFRVLGPLEVRDRGETVSLGGRKPRALLAVLLLNANETVSTDRLIDLLWGGAPPETATTALHGYVSQLRKVLEPGRGAGAEPEALVTREPGYVLRVGPDELDLDRFETLVARGREARAAGNLDQARADLGSALELWRGRPLADLENEPFAQGELERLDELRLAALEERFEVDLGLGRHAELIPELERHIAQNPLRERPRGQLMLALYRAGRQAEALRAYQDARRTLVEEMGIEPGAEMRRLEQGILEQDPSLDVGPAVGAKDIARPTPAAGRPHRGRLIAAALTGAAVVAGAVLLLAGGESDSESPISLGGGSVAVIDLDTGDVTDAIEVGGTPTTVSVGEGGVFVLDADGQTVKRIEPSTGEVETFGTGGVPTDLAAGAGALWVSNGERSARTQFVGPLATTVSSIDPDTSAIRATVELPHGDGATSNLNANHIAVARDAVWVVDPDYSVSRLDPRDTSIRRTLRNVSAVAVASGDEGVWALDQDGSIAPVSPRSGLPRRVRIAANGLAGLAVGEGAVWTTAPYDGNLWRIDPEPRVVQRTIPVEVGANAVTVGGGAVWVVNGLRGTVSRIDPATNRVVGTTDLGATPRSAAVGEGKLWVTIAGAGSPPAAHEQADAAVGLPADTCGEVFYGGEGAPDRLIVSDMPLRAGSRIATRQMSQAIAFVLRERDFRAGGFTVGYQSCDDSTAQTGIFDPDKCASNAKAYAEEQTVIGLVGPYNSGCAFEQIPIANTARGGPLAILAPSNTDVPLTRVGPTSPEGALEALYPSGERNYARLMPTEASQGAANAVLARSLGARSVFVLDDGGYGVTTAFYFARAARELGLRMAGQRRWNPNSRDQAGLADAVAASGADAVLVSGLLDSNAGAVVRALRERLGDEVDVLGTDGLLPISGLFQAAGDAARGVRVSLAGLAPQVLGPEGRNFVRDFAATQPEPVVDRHSVYSAAATAVMLDAIAASDGTRGSVTDELLATRVASGILGPLEFDSHGDVIPRPITIVRAQHGGGFDTVESIDGAVIDRVVRPPERLVK